MGNPNVHNHKRCPLFLAGHAGGALKGGLHLKAADGTPMANVFLPLMHMLGLDDVKTLGDCTGEFELNAVTGDVAGERVNGRQTAMAEGTGSRQWHRQSAVATAASLRPQDPRPQDHRTSRPQRGTMMMRNQMRRWLTGGATSLVAACVLALNLSAAAATVPDAAMNGDREAVRQLLKQGADVNAVQGDGVTALHWAATRGDAEMASMLLSSPARTIARRPGLAATSRSTSPRSAGFAAVVRALVTARRRRQRHDDPRHDAADAGGGRR